MDNYSALVQPGRICPDPGQSTGRSAAVNQLAAESLRQALVMNTMPGEPLHSDTAIHAYIKVYRDLSEGVETDTVRLEGTGKMGEFLSLIRDCFGDSLDVSLNGGISQGCTTTFRGTIRARMQIGTHKYGIACGFVSSADRVTECWVMITPPPTLMECLT